MEHADVLVVGAGPVGLTLAAELRRHGVACRLIEKRREPSTFCKALGVSPRTLEVWDDMGVVREAIDTGFWIRGQVVFVDGQRGQQASVELPDLPFGRFLSLPQYETERILAEHLQRFGTAPEREVELQSFTEDDAGVTASLLRAGGQAETWRGRYLVGCDGAHSTVRHGLGLPFEGDRFPVELLIADIDLDWGLEHGYSYLFIKTAEQQMRNLLVCIPVTSRGRYRVSTISAYDEEAADVVHGPVTDGARPAPAAADVQAIVSRLAPVPVAVGALRWSGYFRISHRIVPRYQVGRVFLAGDAAHVHPPTGGQGMNTGIQDAYNLAWKLALVLRGAADPTLLDSYDAERRPVGELIVRRTTRRSMSLHERTRAEDEAALRDDSQLYLNYRESRWVGDVSARRDGATAGPQPGDRAPDAAGLRRQGVGFPFRLFDLLRGTPHTALFFTDGASEELARLEAVAGALHRRLGTHVRSYALCLRPGEYPAGPGLAIIHDAEGVAHRAFEAAASTACLIRPDGYIGCRAQPVAAEPLLAYLGRLFRPG
jgi:2-polyprenyl-6-methoxyphenol hydroxylase-like FAD-dependent oxidoreductase